MTLLSFDHGTIGSRVQIVKPVDNFPDGFIDVGETGVVVNIDKDNAIWVRLDKNHPELAYWENQVQIWDYSDSPAAEFLNVII